MIRSLRLLLIASLLSATGVQWAALQAMAWAGMTLRGLKTQGVGAAAASAIDGRHPCSICLRVQQGAKSQKKQDAARSGPRLELISQHRPSAAPAPRPLWTLAWAPEGPLAAPPPCEPPPPRSLPA